MLKKGKKKERLVKLKKQDEQKFCDKDKFFKLLDLAIKPIKKNKDKSS